MHKTPLRAELLLLLTAWLLLAETLSSRELAGCALMLGGTLLSQLTELRCRRRATGN